MRSNKTKRRGGILVITVFFCVAAMIAAGAVIDLGRINLARHQITILADTMSFSSVYAVEKVPLMFEKQVRYFQDEGVSDYRSRCYYDYNLDTYLSQESVNKLPQNYVEVAIEENFFGECKSVQEIAYEIYTLNDTGQYQFEVGDPITDIVIIASGEGDKGEVKVEISAVVPMFFSSLLGVDSVTIKGVSNSVVSFFTE